MEHHWPKAIERQFGAAIHMLRSSIEGCPEELWDDRTEGTPFWQIAYHALFYTDFYLSDDEASFRARDFHRDSAHFLPGDHGDHGGIVVTPEEAFTREQLLDYADHCRKKCERAFTELTEARSLERCGFWWYELNVDEFLLNNLRHAQHHAGQLALLLRRRAGRGSAWLGTAPFG